MERLQECRQMLDAGLITEEDYDAVKREVLRLTDVHQTHPPPPIVVGLAAEPAVSTIISVSSNARLNKSRLVCSPDWLTLQLVESDAISFTATAKEQDRYAVHAGGATSSDPLGACAMVSRLADGSYRVDVTGSTQSRLQARFKINMRTGCPCELLVRAGDGALLENVAPRLDPVSGSYVLDFAGRAKLASCKNMLMFKHAPPTGQQLVFRHGKISERSFSCDWAPPLTSLQAFGLSVVLAMEARCPLAQRWAQLCATAQRMCSSSCLWEQPARKLLADAEV